MSGRKVLLIEPNYKNKYPPMGLMKLAMYYRLQGDYVRFWKGEPNDFVVDELTEDFLKKIRLIVDLAEKADDDLLAKLRSFIPDIKRYIRLGKALPNSDFESLIAKNNLALKWLCEYHRQFRSGAYYKSPRWDVVGVTTLFTFYWDITIETIRFALKICKNRENVSVGGVMASVVPDKVKDATGITPQQGVLRVTHFKGDRPLPPPFSKTIIDALPLDYSILDEIDYQYPEVDAFYGYTTRGCVNRCPFCAVPILEPDYRDFIPLKERIDHTTRQFGAQRNLLLLDNNVFASAKFCKIIDEIRECGFGRNDKFVRQDQLKIAIAQLKARWNDRAYLRRIVKLLNEYCHWLENHGTESDYNRVYSLITNNGMLHDYSATREGALAVCKEIEDEYHEWHKRRTHPVVRIVDFNQGLDARLATPEKMKKLAEINIRPLRIAFDDWKFRKQYVRAIKLGADNGISNSSNYLLYNFKDSPDDLYNRLLLNIDLCDALGVNIYSFPMKYHPISDPDYFSNRDYIGKEWSRKFIRAIQSVLNSTHGKIGRGRTFFFKAFGRNIKEFHELLMMPEAFIIKRWDAEINGLKAKWLNAYKALTEKEREFAESIVKANEFVKEKWADSPKRIVDFLDFYLIKREDIEIVDEDKKEKRIIAFEKSCPVNVSPLCEKLLRETT